jgi:hypothetical protein
VRALVLLFGLVGLLAVPGAAPAAAPEAPKSDDCLACHADKDLKRSAKRPGKGESVAVDPSVLKASTHDGLECVACHVGVTAPHDEKLPPVSCAGCHGDVPKTLAGGAHGTRVGGKAPPTCAGCHGTHDIRKAEKATIDTCAGCHASQVAAWRSSVHGRAARGGDADAATCRSCHGSTHTVMTKTDPKSPTYHLNLPRTCAQCHADEAFAKKHGIAVGDVYKVFMDSIHGRALSRSGLLVAANCSDCHGAHGILPRDDKRSRVHRTNVPATCGGCHAGVLAEYSGSVHGRQVAAGDARAPVCVDCHTAHEIKRVEAEAWRLEVIRECGTCHAESLRTYRDTFHGKVTALGFSRVARCSDCHGAHGVQPVSDPRSAVNPANLVTTCGTCHPAVNANFVKFDPHADPENRQRSPLLHYTWRFMTWLLVGTFSFFGLHTVLWAARSLVGGRNATPHDGSPPTDRDDPDA